MQIPHSHQSRHKNSPDSLRETTAKAARSPSTTEALSPNRVDASKVNNTDLPKLNHGGYTEAWPSETHPKVLVMDNDADVQLMIKEHEADWTITHTTNGLEGMQLALQEEWDLLIANANLPQLSGFEVCRRIREQRPLLPILLLTQKSSPVQQLLGFELGADEALCKPCNNISLRIRAQALINRTKQWQKEQPKNTCDDEPTNVIFYQDRIRIDKSQHTLHLDGELINLTAKEFDLLWFFASSPGTVFNRLELLEKVWGYGHVGYEHTVNSHINRLRAKIEKDPAKPEFIQTIWGVGYRFGGGE